MEWTKDQLSAINEEGTNIIISAGAGSGKTAVLTERVYRKLQSGVSITNLLVLTFTNAAAASMKEKIRKRIKKEPSLKQELELIDSAYISTFDSFSLSLVKKYHTYLNITNNIEITDDVVINLEKKKILNSILEEKYSNPTKEFKELINNFCLKDDDNLINWLLNIYSKIELKYDKESYLNNYFKDRYNDENIKLILDNYLELIIYHIKNMNLILDDIKASFDGDYYTDIYNSVSKLLDLTDYETIKNSLEIKLPSVPKGTPEYQKSIKESLKKEIDTLKELCIYDSLDEAKEELLETKSNLKEIINILIELNTRLTKYKEDNNVYNFTDIAHLAIKVVKENDDIRYSLKNSFNEILIDEYQDTSDTQEEFISLISNNNVYMVGDIKQSIYRFRNANPYIFKDKYDLYRDTDEGIKIDLLKNFRSRREVLENINDIFNRVMSDDIGGAAYKESHNMVFGNMAYENEGAKDNNYLEVINYNLEDKKYTNSEYEAFAIVNDILTKLESKIKVYDKDSKVLRKANYSDFCIMIDRSKDFDLYKEIFTYYGIPLTIVKDNTLTNEDDVFVISNLIKLIIKVKENSFDNSFIYSFISVARSYLYSLSDKDIYDIYINKTYKDTNIYLKCLELTNYLDILPPEDFYEKMIETFNYEEKLITKGDIDDYLMKEEYIYNLIKNFSKTGKTIYEFSSYLEEIFENELDISFKTNDDTTNSVKLMTIHKSKGLEFPICYYSGLTSKFNLPEFKDKIYYDNNYGIVLPKVDDFYKDTILKTITKRNGIKEDISERIRLLYVALTRAEEKMIILLPNNEDESDYSLVPDYLKEKYSSFEKILNSINLSLSKYKHEVKIDLSKKYKSNKKTTNFDKLKLKEDNLVVNEINIESHIIEDKHFSKESLKINTKEQKELLSFGTKVHEILEVIDFSNYDLSLFNIDDSIKEKITNFINSNIIQNNINNKMYKKYEYTTKEDDENLHGIIDLLIEGEDSCIIIDYKLKNIDDENYDKQLNGYRKYIENKTGKETTCYLYSILNEDIREVKRDE